MPLFLAVEMALEDGTDGPVLVFRTNLDDVVRCGPEHPMRFAPGDAPGEFRPYVMVRHGLEARLTRAAAFDLIAQGEVRDVEGAGMFGIASGGMFFPIMPADELERLARSDTDASGAA